MSGVLNDNKFVCRHQRGLSDCRGEEATEKKKERAREQRDGKVYIPRARQRENTTERKRKCGRTRLLKGQTMCERHIEQ